MSEKEAEVISQEVLKNMLHNVDVLIASSDQYSNISAFEQAVGISPGYLSRLKKASRNPSLAITLKMAEVLNISLDALLYSHFAEAKTDNENIQYLTYFAKQTMNATIRWRKLLPPNEEDYDDVLYQLISWEENTYIVYNFQETGEKESLDWAKPDEVTDFIAEIPNQSATVVYARLMKKNNESRLDIILCDKNHSPEVLCQISSKTTYRPLLEAAKALSNAIQQQMCNTTFNPRAKAIMSILQKQIPLVVPTDEATTEQ